MGGINTGKLLVAGLVAGLVYNVGQSVVHLFLLADAAANLMAAMELPDPTGAQIGFFWLLGFLIGLAMMFIYAGFRPRFGAGVGTAVIAGVVTYVLAELIPALFYIGSGMFSFAAYLPFLATTLIILLLGAVIGAWTYSEGPEEAMAHAT